MMSVEYKVEGKSRGCIKGKIRGNAKDDEGVQLRESTARKAELSNESDLVRSKGSKQISQRMEKNLKDTRIHTE